MAAKRARAGRPRSRKSSKGKKAVRTGKHKTTEVRAQPREHRIGKYVVDGRPLGRGGMAHVHKVRSRAGKLYAIKELRAERCADREHVKRFQREFEVGSNLKHANIVKAYECFEEDGTWHIRMEYLPKGSLEELVDSDEPFSPGHAAALALPLLSALEHAHRRGTVHRDIKPGNVLLTQHFDLKLADFGIARVEETKLTRAGTMLGTPAYMAPEQLDGTRPDRIDGRADLHALGVLLYELVSGRNPYGLGARSDMLRAARIKREREPRSLDDLEDPDFSECILTALARDPDERYESAAAMRRALATQASSSTALTRELRRRHRAASTAREARERARSRRPKRRDETSSPPHRLERAMIWIAAGAAVALAIFAATQIPAEHVQRSFERALEWLGSARESP